ncbi:MAG: hypothetical protein JXB39_13925 [Deltaproteobacteria bacterium]|nr:hypothetical protein [Deltaproteobacteria bacterium]
MNVHWRQRLTHEGASSIRLDLASGLRVRFDPLQPPVVPDVVILTWNEAERIKGVRTAILSGASPRVVGLPTLLQGLAREGEIQGIGAPCEVRGIRIEMAPYEPVSYVTRHEGMQKARSALKDPFRAARRLLDRARLPPSKPAITRLSLPDGTTLVHLNGALHASQEGSFLEEYARRWSGADLVIVGCDYGHEATVEESAPWFEGRLLVLADLFGDVRRSLGMPTVLLTPIADRLTARGVPVAVLASGASLRFE